jgi:HAE1 family hydrophobic/amphiphilic exporter-1
VTEYYTTIGNYVHNNVVNAGTIYVTLKDPRSRKLKQREVMDQARDALLKLLPGTEVFGQDLSLAGFSASRGFPIEFVIEGPDWARLQGYAADISRRLKATGLVADLNFDYQAGMPEIQIIPDRDRAAERGVSVQSIGTEVQALVGGQILGAATQYPQQGHRYDIRVRSEPSQNETVGELAKIGIRNNRGQLVPLSSTSRIEETRAPQLISRYDRRRAIPVFANVAAGQSQQAALDAVARIGRESLPEGYAVKVVGSGHAFQEAFDGLIFAILLGVAVAYMILASQFNSFLHPVTVLMALPFSVTGALLALWATHQSLSLFSMIGLILLMGIVKKNSILLVDFTNQRRDEGAGVTDALLEACPVRLRPILMTSVATVAGAIPEALNFGAGAETRVPMAISIIGGVAVSTFLTLYVIPCIYSLFSKLERPEKPEPDDPLPHKPLRESPEVAAV